MNEEISLFSLKNDIKDYSWKTFGADVSAALCVVLLTVPQSIAYSLLAGLPLTCGLFSAIYSAFIASLFGSSRYLIVGPSNALAILVQSAITEILSSHYDDVTGSSKELISMQILTLLCLAVGLIQLVIAKSKLGSLIRFVSDSVIIGYMSGTALAVIVNQLFPFFGIPAPSGDLSLYEKLNDLYHHFSKVHFPSLFIGIFSLFFLIVLRKKNSRIPSVAVMLLCAIGLTQGARYISFYWDTMNPTKWQNVHIVGELGTIDSAYPHFAFPYFNLSLLHHLLPIAFAMTLLNIMETISVAKTLAFRSGQPFSMDQEIFGVSLGNITSSFLSAMPVSGSPARSILNYISGAKTRVAALLSAVFTAIFIYFFHDLVLQIPLTSLAALLFVTAINILNPKQLLGTFRKMNIDTIMIWTILFSCIFFSLDIAFYVGVVLSILFYGRKSKENTDIEFLDYKSDQKIRAVEK